MKRNFNFNAKQLISLCANLGVKIRAVNRGTSTYYRVARCPVLLSTVESSLSCAVSVLVPAGSLMGASLQAVKSAKRRAPKRNAFGSLIIRQSEMPTK